jgi:hypothetical protein
MIRAMLVGVLVFLAAGACAKKNKKASSLAPEENTKSSLALSEITSGEGCLNLSLIRDKLRSLSPAIQEKRLSTQLEISGERPVRPNFRRLMVNGNFVLEQIPVVDEDMFAHFEQSDCRHVVKKTAESAEETFFIKESTANTLLLENTEDINQGMEVKWVTPQRLTVKTTFQAHDLPCGDSTKPYLVTSHITLDWSGKPLDYLEGRDSALMVQRSFLVPLAESVGMSPEEFYRDPAVQEGEESAIRVSKLEEVLQKPLKPEVMECSEGVPAGPPAF